MAITMSTSEISKCSPSMVSKSFFRGIFGPFFFPNMRKFHAHTKLNWEYLWYRGYRFLRERIPSLFNLQRIPIIPSLSSLNPFKILWTGATTPRPVSSSTPRQITPTTPRQIFPTASQACTNVARLDGQCAAKASSTSSGNIVTHAFHPLTSSCNANQPFCALITPNFWKSAGAPPQWVLVDFGET